MMKNRRLYTAEFKLRMVKEVIEKHKRPSAVAREHKILASTLFSWRALYEQFGENAFVASAQQAELLETENTNLHKQLERLKTQEIVFERLLGKMTLENHRLREQINTIINGKVHSRTT
jgi:transposase-like protein